MKRQGTVSPSETARRYTINLVLIRHCFMNQRSLSRRRLLSLRHEFVSDSRNGAEVNRVRRVGFEFLTKVENLVVDGAGRKVETHTPPIVQYLFTRNRSPWIIQKVGEKFNLVCCKGHQ